MRPRKDKISIDLDRPIPEEEHGLKIGRKVKVEIKPKIEVERDMDDSNPQVQALKKFIYNMR
jgi:hypothetical protein